MAVNAPQGVRHTQQWVEISRMQIFRRTIFRGEPGNLYCSILGLHIRQPADGDKLASFKTRVEFGAVKRHRNASLVMIEGGTIVKASRIAGRTLNVLEAEYPGD